MGTPKFAIPALEAIIKSKHELLAVYTRKPKESNRGQKIQNTPIYNLALENNLKIFTPKTFKNSKNLEELQILKPDLIVVVAYGLILTKELLEIPKYGCINIHPSLLPRWRGCAPLERCLMSDDEETGVCIMEVDEGLDSGGIIRTYRTKIKKDTDIISLKQELSLAGTKMLIETIDEIEKNGMIKSIKQPECNITIADKITNEDAVIDWNNNSVVHIHKKIMALSDSVGVYILHNKNRIKILKSDYILQENNFKYGTIIDKNFSIGCKDGILKPLILQKEGKKSIPLKEFINGYKFNVGDSIKG